MNQKRALLSQEKLLIRYLLQEAGLDPSQFSIAQEVDEYEGGVMGSIGLGKEGAEYAGDILQAGYTDSDGTQVVITLTKDTENQLLDLDFWKTDFSKLLQYPVPEKLNILRP